MPITIITRKNHKLLDNPGRMKAKIAPTIKIQPRTILPVPLLTIKAQMMHVMAIIIPIGPRMNTVSSFHSARKFFPTPAGIETLFRNEIYCPVYRKPDLLLQGGDTLQHRNNIAYT
jgi:hypothetical protein